MEWKRNEGKDHIVFPKWDLQADASLYICLRSSMRMTSKESTTILFIYPPLISLNDQHRLKEHFLIFNFAVISDQTFPVIKIIYLLNLFNN